MTEKSLMAEEPKFYEDSLCGCLFGQCLSVGQAEDPEKEHSKYLDGEIDKERDEFMKTLRLLLLGAGESGKSTIIKQMQLIHVDNFSNALRIQRRHDIRANVVDAIVCILEAMSRLTPSTSVENAENQAKRQWILENATKKDFDFPREFYEYAKSLWNDKGVQETFQRSNEYQLIDSAKYFLDKLDEISKDGYMPSDQDILRCRVLTTGITDLTFIVKNVTFRIIDVGGQRDERRKWFLCFNDVTAIIFVAACSSYDMVLREDPCKNRLHESLDLFKTIWNNRWLGHISVIVFLNKKDLFEEKILSGRSKLEDYFPAFRDFKSNESNANEHPEVSRAKQFLKKCFEEISMTSNVSVDHRFFPHFTCAVDTENIRRVFENCKENIQIRYLKDYDLI